MQETVCYTTIHVAQLAILSPTVLYTRILIFKFFENYTKIMLFKFDIKY